MSYKFTNEEQTQIEWTDPVSNTTWSGIECEVSGNTITITSDHEIGRKVQEAIDSGNTPGPYVSPIPAVPQQITKYQAKIILKNTPWGANSNMLEVIKAAVAASGEDSDLWIAYHDALYYNRNSPFILSLQTQFGLSNSEIDRIFIYANQIE